MRTFITGGSGFLGRRIVHWARELGHEALAPRSAECDLLRLESVSGWIAEQKTAGRSVEAIVSSAAYYGGLEITMSEPATILMRNLTMISNLFQAATAGGVRKIVVVGSACGYPGSIVGDMKESDFWSGPLHPSVEGYGFTKKAQLVAQRAVHKQYGIEGNHMVLTNLYGPNDTFTEYRGHAISVLIKRYVDATLENAAEVVNWGDGSAIREFIHVDDAARVVASFLDKPHDLEPVNVGTGIGTSIRELTDYIAEAAGYGGRVKWDETKPNGVPRKVLDVTRLRTLLPDFRPKAIREGVRETVEWYRANKAEADKRA